ncbi:Gp138 family membrane-puncturing spike protein [Citrobacter sp.]|uniref:Gp138 family membrane-puncturing spike protein n=1 Tax=Citrobacter sp. TaxID=1896336 RepID=UPI002FCAEDD5
MAQQPKILAQRSNDNRSLPAALESINQKVAADQDGLLPAIIVSYDRKTNLAVVRPVIQVVMVNNGTDQRKPLARIHVLSLGAGGFHINFPVKKGDLGWILAADRDISAFRETLKEASPTTSRMHTFSDGWWIPDVFRQYVINGEDSDAMVIQSTDGATRISIRGDNIKITAPSKVVVDVPQSEFTGNVTIDKNLIVTGTTNVNGGFTAASGKPCSLPTETTVDGKKVDGHVHSNPEGGNVGPF